MRVFTQIRQLQAFLEEQRFAGKKIGLVPTMGALHRGHASLVEASRANGDLTVCSLFVNPAQFNDPADLARYPRSLQSDTALLRQAGCEALFAPEDIEMYAYKSNISFDFGHLDKVLEGAFRPGHFSGVALVVAKLFNIFKPDQAYFGCKDYQQFKIISTLNKDLNFGINLHCLPTVRETDGLAMSSRNLRLKPDERKQAAVLYRNLSIAKQSLLEGKPWEEVRARAVENFKSAKDVRLEYFELADADSLNTSPLSDLGTGILLAAAFVGPVRLIDNLRLK